MEDAKRLKSIKWTKTQPEINTVKRILSVSSRETVVLVFAVSIHSQFCCPGEREGREKQRNL